MSTSSPVSAGTRVSIWLSAAVSVLALLMVAYDLAVSGLLTLRSGYTLGAVVVGLGMLLMVGAVRIVASRTRGLPRREWWAVGAPLLAAGSLWAVVLVLSRVRL